MSRQQNALHPVDKIGDLVGWLKRFAMGKEAFSTGQIIVAALRLAELEAENRTLRLDTKRLDWLQENFIGADFAYGEDARCILIIDLPRSAKINVSLRDSADAAMSEDKPST